jgi:transcriptional regulator with XRE-family HTH domain
VTAPATGQPDHGTRARYVRGCHCPGCTEANRRGHAHRERMILYGRWRPFVDASRARDHVQALSAAGIGWRRAAELAGVSPASVNMLLRGRRGRAPSQRIRPETEQKILAVRPGLEALSGGALVDATGAQRRLRALVAAGHSQARLGARLGISSSNFEQTMTRDRLTAETVRAVRALYDELWDVPPDETGHRTKIAASRARNYARARSWAPPLAWDEEELDAPDGKPADGWRRPARQTTRAAELAEDAEFVRQLGGYRLATNTEVAMRLGVPRDRLEKALERTRSREAQADREAG